MKCSMSLRLPARLRSPLAILTRGASNTISNFGCPFLGRLEKVLAKFKTREVTPRRHAVTAKLTCGPLVAWLSVWGSFGVRNVVQRNQICGVTATLGKSGLPLSGHCSLLVLRALGTGSSFLDGTKIVEPVLVHFVH